MPRYRRIGRSRFTLAVLVVASLTALTLDFRDTAPVRALRSAASTVFSPLQSAADGATGPVRNLWHGAADYDSLKKQDERLRQEVDRARGDRIRARRLAKENEALRKIADIKVGNIQKVGARVLTGPLSNFDREIEIDVGSGNGVKVGMVVVTDAGIVGTVDRVSGGRARVELITDPSFRMGVRFAGSDVPPVVVQGNGQNRPLVADGGVSADKPVKKGEAVTTSGDPRSPFPPGVPVGTVRSSRQSKDFAEKSVLIDPSADLGALSYVAVLLYEAPG